MGNLETELMKKSQTKPKYAELIKKKPTKPKYAFERSYQQTVTRQKGEKRNEKSSQCQK